MDIFTEGMSSEGLLKEIFSGTLMSENSFDFIIPDYTDDVEKILLCTALPKIEGTFVDGSSLEIEGNITFRLLLCTEGSTLAGLTYTEPFDIKKNIGGLDENCIINLHPVTNYVTARLLNPRKVNIRCQIDTEARVFCTVLTTPSIIGTESIEDDMNLKRKYSTVRTAECSVLKEKNIPAALDIELDASYPQAEEIILCSVKLCPAELRANGDQLDTKTDVLFSCIYRSDDGRYYTAEKKLGLEKSIPSAGCGQYSWDGAMTAGAISAKIAANGYGEMKVIEIDFPYDIEASGLRNKDIQTVCDMYSTDYECDTEENEITSAVFNRNYSSSVSVNCSAKREDISADAVSTVFAGDVTVKSASSAYDPEKKKLVTEGELNVRLICTEESEDTVKYAPVSFEYPFRCETDCRDDLSSAELSLSLDIGDVRYRADSQSLYCDLELSVGILALEHIDTKYLKTARLCKDRPVSHVMSPITLSYPSGKETLWDIAKYYKTTKDGIIASNGLQSEDISGKKVLLIPRMTRQKPLFSKVI